ncbi:hypothetical protein PIB30_042585 [Stylosanthes scabra]|uniref:Uncharacterized protein n=1 Tax=Stylosanthes scabra TaxID=79078 RepID=A0ABU6THC4_9FABA|nr:hypothetical protein [Stylosanthes scabra]
MYQKPKDCKKQDMNYRAKFCNGTGNGGFTIQRQLGTPLRRDEHSEREEQIDDTVNDGDDLSKMATRKALEILERAVEISAVFS